jgi:hypothetical protein
MNSYKHTNVGDGTARNQYATVGQLQDQGVQALSVGGTANAITASMSPVISSYVTGGRYTFKAISNSSSTVTLKIDSAPAVAVQYNGAALVNGEIAANQWHTVVYDGSVFQLLNPAMSASTRTLPASVAQVQDGDYIWLGTTGGTATAQTATASPAITAYKAGQKFRMKVGAGLASTGNAETTHTLNINGIGAKEFRDNGTGSKPTLGTWGAGSIVEALYDGTYFFIINDPGLWLSYTPPITASGSMTISSVVVNDAVFRKSGTNVTLWLNVSFTTGGTASNSVYITLPVNQIGYAGTTGFSTLNFDGVTVQGFGTFFSATQVQVSKDLASTNFNLGASKFVRFNISYDAV